MPDTRPPIFPLPHSLTSRSVAALESIAASLQVMAGPAANRLNLSNLERSGGSIQNVGAQAGYMQGRQSGIQDLLYSNPEEVQLKQQQADEFAARHNVVPNSEAFEKAVRQFEDQVVAEYGEDRRKEILASFPWNSVSRTPGR